MISVTEAREQLWPAIPQGTPALLPLHDAVGCLIADHIVSTCALPRFDNSAMDGYALRVIETADATPEHPIQLEVCETIAAGTAPTRTVSAGETARIMTGAMIPPGATGVVPQEAVTITGDTIHIAHPITEGAHIRRRGEELRTGDQALTQGTVLTPGGVALLAAMGEKTVPVVPPPTVTILSTGSELVTDAKDLTEGKIFETNAATLRAALGELGITPRVFPSIADDAQALRTVVAGALDTSDFVIITGGVSVGKYDLVKPLLAEQQVETIFWKVAQKPGKPLYCGRRCDTLVFGLPGNPASSLVCYYEYVRAALLKWMGFHDCWLPTETASLATPMQKKGGRTHFVRAVATREDSEWRVRPLSEQGSHCMQSFALANCLLVLPADEQTFVEGSSVTIHWLPQCRGGGL